jgi:hypothetical protein
MPITHLKLFARISIALAALVGLGACGGGGSGGDTAQTAAPEPPATVGILLADAHDTRWDQAFATITSIELLGDEYRQTIFSGNETVDLLSLPDYFELFALDDTVVPGEVSKIRLRVALLELVDLDDMGVEIERVATKLVGNGKIDINPRGTFTIAGGDTLFIELDFDMHKAFKVVETSSGQIIVRPVVFARIVPTGGSSRLTRVFGEVRSTDAETQSFVLCQRRLFSNHDDDDEDDDFRDERCIGVATGDLTGVFNVDGLPVTVADVLVGDELTAIGFLRHEDSPDGDGEGDDGVDAGFGVVDDLVLDAVTLEIGTNFERYAGAVQSAVDGDVFDFLLAPGQGFSTDSVIATQLYASTRIFSKTGEELDLLSIQPDVAGIVDGVIALGGDPAADRLRAALVVLDLEAGEAEELLSGMILAVQVEAGTFDLMVGDVPRCIDASGADVFLISDDDGLVSQPGTLADLAADQQADVYGTEGVSGCFVASDVLVDVSGS